MRRPFSLRNLILHVIIKEEFVNSFRKEKDHEARLGLFLFCVVCSAYFNPNQCGTFKRAFRRQGKCRENPRFPGIKKAEEGEVSDQETQVARFRTPSHGEAADDDRRVRSMCEGGAEGARKDEKLFRALDRAFAAQEENPLRGSPDKLGTEICVAELLGFGNFKTDQDVFLAIQAGELWDLSFSGIIFPPELPLLRRVGRAGTVAYMNELLVAMRDAFPDEEPPILRIPSIVRTVDGQQRLASAGRSPARCDVKGLCSVHTSGGAIDISLRTLNRKQFAWLYERLLRDISDRKVLAILERRGGHFHVFVLPLEITLAYHQSRQVLRAQR